MSQSPPTTRRGPRVLAAVVGVVLLLVAAMTGLDLSGAGQPDPSGPGAPTTSAAPPAGPSTAPPGADQRDQEQVGTDLDPETGLPWVPLDQLPPEAAEVVGLIEAGGPFRHEQDGRTFNNFEGLLPEQPRGWYREYTVPTPGEDDRGARRIVTGDQDRILFWTADHYESFERILR
ncbi:ribonuclease domain-containing protein [Auraticoccus monumenti]|uniref:Ribonuclease T1 n=1 Tax=Auraticoccus monumenti TaxID=675864 RepID=A0A1G7DQE6_9ACTN|nr:ribonuclease domain-containing protein [Auraticoccus monumenti]SDE53754.1 ribonuclease T1 [Auraticoccus monumenti]